MCQNSKLWVYLQSQSKATPLSVQWSGFWLLRSNSEKMYVRSVRLGFLYTGQEYRFIGCFLVSVVLLTAYTCATGKGVKRTYRTRLYTLYIMALQMKTVIHERLVDFGFARSLNLSIAWWYMPFLNEYNSQINCKELHYPQLGEEQCQERY